MLALPNLPSMWAEQPLTEEIPFKKVTCACSWKPMSEHTYYCTGEQWGNVGHTKSTYFKKNYKQGSEYANQIMIDPQIKWK